MTFDRRQFLKYSGASASLAGLAFPHIAGAAAARPKVIVVGAGFGGATCAKYLKKWDANIDVTLIDPSPHMVSCPMSNWVIGGLRKYEELIKPYNKLPKYGIKMVRDLVIGVDPEKRVVVTQTGKSLSYDRLVLAPGVDFNIASIEGYASARDAGKVMHAFKAGPETQLLRKQLLAMRDGGVVVIGSPPPPGRCVSGPYERACMIAYYLKQHKPKSKIVMLDAAPDVVSKGEMFKAAWKRFYPGMIEHRPYSNVIKVDHKSMTVSTDFDDVQGDVINLIPRQRAGKICDLAGVRTDSAKTWCPVDYITYESPSVPNVHIIGDSVQSNMPKSAHVSNNQAKICAAAIIELFAGRQPDAVPVIGSTSYSVTSDSTAGPIAVVMRYNAEQRTYLRQPGGGASPESDELNFAYNLAWFESIWTDTLG